MSVKRERCDGAAGPYCDAFERQRRDYDKHGDGLGMTATRYPRGRVHVTLKGKPGARQESVMFCPFCGVRMSSSPDYPWRKSDTAQRNGLCDALEWSLVVHGHTYGGKVLVTSQDPLLEPSGARWKAWTNVDIGHGDNKNEVEVLIDGTIGGSPEFVLGKQGSIVSRLLAELRVLGWQVTRVHAVGVTVRWIG